MNMTTRSSAPHVGDLVEIHGHQVGEHARLGEILEVLGEPGHPHFRVRWEDGRESIFYPSSDAIVRPALQRLADLAHLLLELCPGILPSRPIESHPGRLCLQPLRAKQGGQCGRDPVKGRCPPILRLRFLVLDLFPLGQGLVGVGHDPIAENMGMPMRHLGAEPLDDVVHRELSAFRPELAVEHDLEEQVPELLHEMISRAFVDGFQDLIGFLDEVRLQGRPGLLTIPGTAAFTPEASHEREEGGETNAGGVTHGKI